MCPSLGLSCMGLFVPFGPKIDYFLFHVGKIFNYNLFKNFLIPFLFPFLLGPLIRMLVHLILSQRSLRLSSVLFILFTLFCSSKVISTILDFPAGSGSKASAYNVGDPGLIPGLGRSSGEGNGDPLQYSCLENPMNGGAW